MPIMIVDRGSDALFATEIALGRLDRDVTEKKLNLFQFATGCMTQTSTRPTQVVGCQLPEPGFRSVLPHYMPHRLF
jgi:hypothetical protein